MNKKVQIEAQIEPVTRKADGSVSIRFTSAREVPTAEFAALDTLRGDTGWLLFAANKMTEKDVPDFDADSDERKSPSQRLRNTLYVWHKQRGGTDAEFNQVYREQMETLINRVKSRLE